MGILSSDLLPVPQEQTAHKKNGLKTGKIWAKVRFTVKANYSSPNRKTIKPKHSLSLPVILPSRNKQQLRNSHKEDQQKGRALPEIWVELADRC